jgi:hypothetical protein
MIFKAMKQEDVRKALKGHSDIMKPSFDAVENLIKTISCPACGSGGLVPVVNSRVPFKEGSIVPNYLAKCESCRGEFEPYTGIQVTLPKP